MIVWVHYSTVGRLERVCESKNEQSQLQPFWKRFRRIPLVSQQDNAPIQQEYPSLVRCQHD